MKPGSCGSNTLHGYYIIGMINEWLVSHIITLPICICWTFFFLFLYLWLQTTINWHTSHSPAVVNNCKNCYSDHWFLAMLNCSSMLTHLIHIQTPLPFSGMDGKLHMWWEAWRWNGASVDICVTPIGCRKKNRNWTLLQHLKSVQYLDLLRFFRTQVVRMHTLAWQVQVSNSTRTKVVTLPSVRGPWATKNNRIMGDVRFPAELDISSFLEKNI